MHTLHCVLTSVTGPGGFLFAQYNAVSSVPAADVVFVASGQNAITVSIPWLVIPDQFQYFETTHTGDAADRPLLITLNCDFDRVSLDPFDGQSVLYTQQASWQIKAAPLGSKYSVFTGTDSCMWSTTDVAPYLGVGGYYLASPDFPGGYTSGHFVVPPLDPADGGSYIRVSSNGQDALGSFQPIMITYQLLIPLDPNAAQTLGLFLTCTGVDTAAYTTRSLSYISGASTSQDIGFSVGCPLVDITCTMIIDMASEANTSSGLDMLYKNPKDITFSQVGGNCAAASSSTGAADDGASSSTGVADDGASSSTGAANSGISGDPQFVGFRGQSYQVHGIPGQIYDIVSTPRMQVNARFIFLSSGVCPRELRKSYCYTHPGTFLGEVGIRLRIEQTRDQRRLGLGMSEETTIRIEAGAWKDGLRVYVNETLIDVSTVTALDLKHPSRPLSHARLAHLLIASGAGVGPTASATAALTQQGDGQDSGDDLSNITSVEVLEQEWKEAQQRLATQRVDTDSEKVKAAGGLFDQKRDNATSKDFLRRTWHRWVLSHPSSGEVQLLTPDFSLTFLNSDGFLNQEVRLINPRLMRRDEEEDEKEDEEEQSTSAAAYASSRLACHGVLGQTVLYRRYPNRWRFIQGDINEYQVDHILATNSKYNVYAHHDEQQPAAKAKPIEKQ